MTNYYLEQEPPYSPPGGLRGQHFIFDGTFLRRPHSLAALMDGQTHMVVAGQYGVSENSEPQLLAFFQPLIQEGLQPLSFTVDGNPHVIKLLRKLWPEVAVQRCLIHIQRQGLVWCRSYPKTTYARKLRQIFLQITQIRNQADRDRFINVVAEWEDRYGSQIRYRPERGQVFSDIKRARSMLLRALPDMFYYLDDPQIPTSTNSLEGYFSRLKSHYRQHRGLSKTKRESYFKWYFHLVPK